MTNKLFSTAVTLFVFVTILGCSKEENQIQVTTNSITQIDITRVSGEASVIVGKDAICLDVGICWDTLPDPIREKKFKIQGTGSGDFSFEIRDLYAETKYFIRAYARDLNQTYYGNQLQFWTQPPFFPGLTIDEITNITDTSAVTGGNIYDISGAEITERGVAWSSKHTNPILEQTSSVFNTNDGAGAGIFISKLTELKPNTTYYVRAYAINKAGVGYSGEIKQFTTKE